MALLLAGRAIGAGGGFAYGQAPDPVFGTPPPGQKPSPVKASEQGGTLMPWIGRERTLGVMAGGMF